MSKNQVDVDTNHDTLWPYVSFVETYVDTAVRCTFLKFVLIFALWW